MSALGNFSDLSRAVDDVPRFARPVGSIRLPKSRDSELSKNKHLLTVHGVVFAVFVFEPLRRV
jgi:hypothetical protein